MGAGENDSEEQVLIFLAEGAGEFVSGEAMSGKLGLSRAAVWKHINGLREKGYRIDAVPARGYRLVEIPDRLTALEVGPLLGTRELGRTIHHLESIGSTSDLAKQLAAAGAEHGEVVIAEQQTAGRGRRGRAWTSAPGKNVTLSVILRPELEPARTPELTLVASVAICEAVRHAGVEAKIKWPNDLVVNGRKLAGILTEMVSEPERVQWVVLGIGVNVNVQEQDFPSELRGLATSLRIERGMPAPRALFTAALLGRLEDWLDRHHAEGFEPIRRAWSARSATLGQDVRIETGGKTFEGKAEEIDPSGALWVRCGAERVRVVAGDVEHLRERAPR